MRQFVRGDVAFRIRPNMAALAHTVHGGSTVPLQLTSTRPGRLPEHSASRQTPAPEQHLGGAVQVSEHPGRATPQMYIGIVRCTTIREHASLSVRSAALHLQEFPLWHA